jgi:hypothetical protein
VTLRCPLSRRQKELYAALRKNLTLQDLVAMNSKMAAAAAAAAAGGAAAGGSGGPAAAPVTAASSSAASARLMGLIMQMRKVGAQSSETQWLVFHSACSEIRCAYAACCPEHAY